MRFSLLRMLIATTLLAVWCGFGALGVILRLDDQPPFGAFILGMISLPLAVALVSVIAAIVFGLIWIVAGGIEQMVRGER